MSRFTEQRQDMYGYFTPVDGVEGMACVQELGEIEDILYAPDGTERITLEALKALVDGYADGRLVVLPCKVGDTVYVLPNYTAYWDDIEETKITGVSQFPAKVSVSNQIVTSIGLCYEWERDFGVRLFLTLAEAEAALKEAQHE